MSMRSTMMAMAAVLCLASLPACVQYPTERQGVVDLRPGLSFKVANPSANPLMARVTVDGLDVGAVGDFLVGQTLLRVVPGNHVVRVVQDGTVFLEQRVYLGDG